MKRIDDIHLSETWVFDLDNTLYPASCGLMAEVSHRMTGYVADLLGVDREAALIEQKRLFREHGTTLRGLMDRFEVDPIAFMDHVHDVDYSCVAPSTRLAASLAALPGRKIVYTNASAAHAEAVLERLGIAHAFDGVFDVIAADYRPKPDPLSYSVLAERFAFAPERAVMVEDIAHNLAPAHALGMTTVWVRPADAVDPYWATQDETADYVHHRVEDIEHWLDGLAARLTDEASEGAPDRADRPSGAS